jgi:hypothetical protein
MTKRLISTRMTLVKLDHEAVVRCLREAASRPPPAVIFIAEVPVSPSVPPAQEAPAPAMESRPTTEAIRTESTAVEPKWDPDKEWIVEVVLRELGLKARAPMYAVIEAIGKLPEQSSSAYHGWRITDILDSFRGPADPHKLVKKVAGRETCRRFLSAWRTWRAHRLPTTSS